MLAWDWYRSKRVVGVTDWWMAAARAAGVRPLITFSRNWRPSGQYTLPPLELYRKSFRTFRRRYPDIREFAAWNEANHTAQPTANKPKAAARYFNAMRRDCRTFYEWRKQPRNRWDSAFLNADGSLRPAYHALVRGLRRG